jgi:hypothetical protein
VTGEVATSVARQLQAGTASLDAHWLWARSGGMALTGDADGPPLASPAPVAALLEAAGDLLTVLSGRVVLADPSAVIGERAAIFGYTRHGQVSCGGGARLVRAADRWVAVALPRPEDRGAVPAWLGSAPPTDDPWPQVAAAIAGRAASDVAADARLLEIPCAVVGETPPPTAPWRITAGPPGPPVERPLVVDLSALWAGPLCADLLARAGALVVKVEDPARPDGARAGPPEFADLLNADKRSVAVDLRSEAGRRDLARLLAAADVVVSSSRPRAFDRLGIDAAAVLARGPTVWVAITAHGWSGPGRDRVGFGDDAAVAGGLVAGGLVAGGLVAGGLVAGGLVAGGSEDGAPRFLADAIADPLTGVLAAVAALATLARGGSWFVDASLGAAAAFARGLGTPAGTSVAVAPPRARRPDGVARDLGADTAEVLTELAAGGR